MNPVPSIITLDGPAASGKSSVAQRVADTLGVAFVSSGLLYRLATLVTLQRDVDANDVEAILTELGLHDVRLHADPNGNRLTLDGRDVTQELHTDAVDGTVSTVAAHPELRAWVNARLREIEGSFVIDGRDMGRDVFPNAAHKFFLTARPEVRAARRVGERSADLAAVTEAIRQRDEGDQRQSRPADDATLIDTSDLTLQQVIDRVLDAIHATEGAT